MLETLGCEIQASESRAKATREARNKVTDRKLRQALHDGRLGDAEALLRLVSQDSVYREALSDLFDRANAVAVSDVKRRSYALASAHDCAGLKRYLIQQITGTTSTETTITVINGALTTCTLGENPPTGTHSTSRAQASFPDSRAPSGADMMEDADSIPSER